MQVSRIAAWTAAALAITAGAAACSDDGGGASGTDPGAYVVKIGVAEPQHLIPSDTTESSGNQVLAALFSPLVVFDDKNAPHEEAAESITSTDNTVWTVKLKPGYTFHNGEPVIADNYIDAWNYGAYGPNAQGGSYFFEKIAGYADMQAKDPDGAEGPQKAPQPKAKTLTGLKKVDDLTFTVTLSAPFSEFKAVLGYNVFYPLPKAAFSAPGTLAKGFEDAIIGQGPFKIKGTWQHDSKIEVQRYDAFPGTKPKVGGVTFTIYQQPTAEYADLVAGNNDVMRTIPIESLATAGSDLGDRLQKSPLSSFQFLAFPTFQPEFAKADVRKAISMALDRDEMVTAIFLGSQTAARSFVSPVVAGARENTCGEACVFDPAKAKALYTSAGGPAKLQISYNGDGGHKSWVDAACGQLRNNLGVDCNGTPEPKFADLLSKVEVKKPVGMFRMAWSMDYPSMENYLGPLYSTNGSSNYYGYSNPEFDTLVQEGTRAATVEASIAKYQQAEDILAKDMPVIPLRFGQNVFGHSEKVRNVMIDKFGKVDLFTIEAA